MEESIAGHGKAKLQKADLALYVYGALAELLAVLTMIALVSK
jgi:hypothetical protein